MNTGSAALVFASHCVGCGKGLISTAAMCPSCGTPVRSKSVSRGKDKTVAILLAVFLSGWTWLYTYRVNAAKFWIYIGFSFFFALIGIAAFVAFVAFDSYVYVEPAILVGFAFWLWAVIDAATKSREYYENYE